MASIYKRGGIWWGRYRGERKSLATGSKSVAQDRLDQWVGEAQATGWKSRKRVLISDVIAKFSDEHLTAVKPSTALRYAQSLGYIARHLDGRYLSDIGSAMLHEIEVDRRRQGVKNSTIRRDLAALSALVTFAETLELTAGNPVIAYMRKRKRQGLKESEPRKRYLSHEEERTLLRAMRDDGHAMLAAAVALAIDTGLRSQELLGLTWRDVDLDRREITVASDRAKSGVGRVVPILDRSRDILAKIPRARVDGYVIWHGDGHRYGELYHALLKVADRVGITDLRWHDLRRTCGCRLLQDHSMPIERVSRWLGHSSVVQTERAYAFLDVRHLHAAVQSNPRLQIGGGHRWLT